MRPLLTGIDFCSRTSIVKGEKRLGLCNFLFFFRVKSSCTSSLRTVMVIAADHRTCRNSQLRNSSRVWVIRVYQCDKINGAAVSGGRKIIEKSEWIAWCYCRMAKKAVLRWEKFLEGYKRNLISVVMFPDRFRPGKMLQLKRSAKSNTRINICVSGRWHWSTDCVSRRLNLVTLE